MDKILKLLEIAKKFGVKPSKVIGTQGNIVPYKKPSLVSVNVDEFKLKESVDSGAMTMDKVQQEMEETVRLALSKNLNDVELQRALNNAINIDRQFFPPMAEVVEAGSKQQVTGKGLEELIDKEGLVASPKTPLGKIQFGNKRAEQEMNKIIKEYDLDSLLKGIGKDQLSKIRLHNEGLVRAVTRQILYEDIKAGKIKNLTLDDLGTSREPIDYFRKIYGENALEQLDSLTADFNRLNTEQEAAKLARSKFKFEPDETRVKGSTSYEELEKNIKGPEQSKEAKILNITNKTDKRKTVDELIDEYNTNFDRTKLTDKEGGTEIGYQEFQNIQKRNDEIAKALEEKGIKSITEPEEVKPEGIVIPFRKKFTKPEPEGKAQGGIIGYAMGGRIGFQEGGDIRNVIKEFEKEGITPSSFVGSNGIEFKLVTGRFSGKPVYKAFYPENYDFSKGVIGGSTASEFDPEYFFKNIMAPEGTYFDAEKNNFLPIVSTPKVPTVDPFSLSYDPNDSHAFEKFQNAYDAFRGLEGSHNPAQMKDLFDAYNQWKDQSSNIPTIDPFSGQQVSAQEQAAFTQPQAEIFPQQELPTVTPEAPFQPYEGQSTSYDSISNRLENIFNNPAIKGYSNFITGSESPFQNINQFTSSQQSVINQAIENAAKEGRTNITYADYPQTGIAQLMDDGFSPMEYVKTLGSSIIGNPVDQIKTTLGQFTYDPQQQQIKDFYDFQKQSGNNLGTPYPININVSNPVVSSPYVPNVEGANELKNRYNQYLSGTTASTPADQLYATYKANVQGKADGGRIGFAGGKSKSILDLIAEANKKLKGKKSMESVNPKTGEVTVPKEPIKTAEEPTGITVMDQEPNIVDEKSILKNKKTDKSRQLTQDEIADYEEQLGDSETWMSEGTVEEAEKVLKRSKAEEAYMYTQYKMGKLDPAPGEQTKSRMDFLRKKAEYAEDVKDRRLFTLDEMNELDELEKIFEPRSSSSIDISDPKTAEAFTNFAKENDPEGFKKIQKIVDDINNKNALEEFDPTGRKSNAKGGPARGLDYLMGF